MKKLAIVCGSPSTEMMAPFDSPDHEVWVLGNRYQRYPRYNRIFEIHDDLKEHGDPWAYAKTLAGLRIPMVVGEDFPIVEEHITVYPFAAVNALFGSEYLTSSSAYMLGLAILEGYTHIEIYGVDMAVDDHEYFWQRPAMEAWVGFAKGRGITVVIPAESPLGKSSYTEGKGCGGKPNFGTPPFTQDGFLAMRDSHQKKVDEFRGQIEQLERATAAHTGALQVYERLAATARAVEAGQKIDKLTDAFALK